jgi:hypothetical protein
LARCWHGPTFEGPKIAPELGLLVVAGTGFEPV